MRQSWALWLAGGSVVTALGVACGPTELSCDETATCGAGISGHGGASGSAGASGTGVGGGTDGGFPRDASGGGSSGGGLSDSGSSGNGGGSADGDSGVCNGTDAPATSPCVIDSKWGVFVSPTGDDTTGTGTKLMPYKTLGKGLNAAKTEGKRLYVCDNGTGYSEQITIDGTLDGISAYGGFDCTWIYAAANRAKVHPATGTPLTVKGLATGATLENFEFDAADATSAGKSSIGAAVVSSMGVVLRGVKVVAGKGALGVGGIDGAKGNDGQVASGPQMGSPSACPSGLTSQNGGAWSGPSLCGSRGGNGGFSVQGTDGTTGISGNPRADVSPPNINNRGSEGATGQDGTKGSDGNTGTAGLPSSVPASFSETGFTPSAPAGNGTDGFPAQGGGGGGASNATGVCIGASGGAGGMGGCGGKLGTGASGGGASVAVLSWMSTLTLDHCELVTSGGGAGGKGGNGGPGGLGKDGAAGGDAYAGDAGAAIGKGGKGGSGGNGGPGGSGAGGNGGPSYALVFKGTAPTKSNATTILRGGGGAGGIGGTILSVKAPDGLPGAAADELSVP